MSVLYLRYRIAPGQKGAGRFVSPKRSVKILRQELWHSGTNKFEVLVEKQFKQPKKKRDSLPTEVEFVSSHKAKLKARSLKKFLTEESVLRRLAGKRMIRVRVKLINSKTKERVTVEKTIKLSTRGKKKNAQNRAIILRALLDQALLSGFRFGGYRPRDAIMARTPVARSTSIEFLTEKESKRGKKQSKVSEKHKPAARAKKRLGIRHRGRQQGKR